MNKKKEMGVDDILKEVREDEEREIEENKSEEGNVKRDEKGNVERTVGSSKDIVLLEEINKSSIPIAGGKGANLAEMSNIGLPVPPAFVITASAYKNFIYTTGLQEKIMSILKRISMENTTQLDEKASEIQLMIVQQKMPVKLEEQIIEAYNNLNVNQALLKTASAQVLSIIKTAREPIYVAVRSSATTEDLKTASFAGQQETFLNIKGSANLIEAVKKCWASLFTARAIYYRERNSFKHDESFIAVVIQKMVNSDKSGVTFSINPVTNNNDEIIIEAVYGLGEGIVSGTIAPDRYVVDKKTNKILDKKISFKPIYFTKSGSGNTVKSDLPADKVHEQVLENYEIEKLANYARDLENHYKHAQDIEWAIEYGRIYIVQTRPVTTTEKNTENIEVKGNIILDGLSASPGLASGIVRIINSMEDLSKIQRGDVLVTKMTNPDMVVTMQKAVAIITDEGGVTCHAAIVSREVGLPAIVGTRKATKVLHDGQIITIDATNGKIYEGDVKTGEIEPEPAEIAEELVVPNEETEEEREIEEAGDEAIGEVSSEEKHSKEKPKIYMNLGEPEKIKQYKNLPFDGIGLMRLEFVIASQIGKHPLYLIEEGIEDFYVDGIFSGVSKVAKAIYPKPIIVRFSDFKTNEYRDLEGGDQYEGQENNPMIGFRGVSRYVQEEFEPAFRLECKAIKKALSQNDNIHVMLPFVRTTKEVTKCLEIMKQEGLSRNQNFKIFLMAEVPSIALIPEEFAKLPIDGASIGSNDLTQLVLGVDRDSALLGRMGYFNERNEAVLQAIYNIIQGFHKHNKAVSICGQAPSVYPEFVEFLVNQNIDSMSVNPDSVIKVREQVEKLFS